MLVVDSNERFDNDTDDYFNQDFCDDLGWIHLLCYYDKDIGVIYNDNVVFTCEEISPFIKETQMSDESGDESEESEENVNSKFAKNNPIYDWYYFYCAPEFNEKDAKYVNNRILIRPNGFILHKDGKKYKIGYTGAHVHLYIGQ